MRVNDTDFRRAESFDLEISVCGYERRATYVARVGLTKPTRRLVVDYQCPGTGAYDDNRDWLEQEGAEFATELEVVGVMGAAARDGARIRVDISSMRRETMARLVHALYVADAPTPVQFVYAPAAYEASADAVANDRVLSAGPVTQEYRGALRPSSIPLGLIAGLGLEQHRVLGLTELLEPARVWAFLAVSDDPRFAASALKVNGPTVDDGHTTVVEYDIRSIASTFAAVESLLFAASQTYRLVVAPSGPKMYALSCLLAAVPQSRYAPAVWRVGGDKASANDLQAAGDVVAAEVEFGAQRTIESETDRTA